MIKNLGGQNNRSLCTIRLH